MALFTYAPSTRHSTAICDSHTVRVVPRIELQWPVNLHAVRYFHTHANLVSETPDIEKHMNWNNVQEWTIFARNQYCFDQLAQTAKRAAEDAVCGEVKIAKIELYDAETHKLLAVA